MEKLFFEELSKILEVPSDQIDLNDQLSKYDNWDSLARVSFIATADDVFQKEVSGDKLIACKTVQDLYQLLK